MSEKPLASAMPYTLWATQDDIRPSRGGEDAVSPTTVTGPDAVTAEVDGYYDQYGELAFRVLLHAFRDCSPDDALEAVQDTFVKLLQTLRRGDEVITHPKAWILTTARRTMLDGVKHGRRTETVHAHLATVHEPFAHAAQTEAEAIRAERRAALTTALPRMTRRERRRFCFRICGLTLKEIGALEGTNLRRVGKSLEGGYRKIQTALGEPHRTATERRRGGSRLTKIADAILSRLRDRGGDR